MTIGDDGLVTVRLLGFPLPTWQRAAEHHDGLMREFALLSMRAPEEGDAEVPRRLRRLVDDLSTQYGSFSEAPDTARDEALAAGLDTVDLTYHVPHEAADAVVALGRMLDEADEFCRNGDLLTLATPPETLAFRTWYLTQFTDQIAGGPPTAWEDPDVG